MTNEHFLFKQWGKSIVRSTGCALEKSPSGTRHPRSSIKSKWVDSQPGRVLRFAIWRSGMGTSARTGLAALLEREPGLNAVLILVCDQPFVSTSLIDRSISMQAKVA